jgi:hypothetical protein
VTDTPQRLMKLGETAQALITQLSIEAWNDGFALVGGVIPIKKQADGGFVIDEARETGQFNNIGDRNQSQSGKLLMALAMEALNLSGEIESQIVQDDGDHHRLH